MSHKDHLRIGHHRPVYLWAGPGTIRMNQLKFMSQPVDEAVHYEAHTPTGAARMAKEAAFNWAYLTFNWGFPPEVEQEDHADFRRAVEAYHAAGVRVSGYIQVSNCVFAGSYRERDWYALDARGRRVFYYTGRYMTDWLHPEWIEHLKQMTRAVIEAGADGVFYDNPWYGEMALTLGGAVLGSVGTYTERARAAFRAATGHDIPTLIDPAGDELSRLYLRWRADQASQTLAMLADYARSLRPDILVSCNNYNAVMHNNFVTYGIDLEAHARIFDVMMIEDFALPRYTPGARPELRNNALTLRTARALCGNTPISTDPYDRGIGWDDVYPPRRFVQGIGEAAACGAVMVCKGTEFVSEGQFTLLTAERYRPQREAIGRYHRWLEAHADLFTGRENAAPVGLLHPGEALWQQWGQVAPLFLGAGQVLTATGIPWRVVRAADPLNGLTVLYHVTPLPAGRDLPTGLRIVDVAALPGWQPPAPPVLARSRTLRRAVGALLTDVYRGYFRWRWLRRLLDALGVPQTFLGSSEFYLPAPAQSRALLDAAGGPILPHVEADQPVLIEAWQRGDQIQIHLLNYATAPQTVRVQLDGHMLSAHIRVISPDGPDQIVDGEPPMLHLDVYSVLLIDPGGR